MKFFRILLLLIGGCLGSNLGAQNIHFSMYNMAPLSLNPALTGAFEGTARIGGIYRDQWASFLRREFVTPSFYIDAPIIRGFKKNHWVGVGMVIVNDRAGEGNLRTQSTMFSGAYHMGLGKDYKNVITFAAQFGSGSRRFDINSLDIQFADELPENVGGGGRGIGAGEDRDAREQQNFVDVGAGLLFRSELNDETNLELGVSVGHLTQPRYNLIGASQGGGTDDAARRPILTTAHGRVKRQLNEKWSVSPGFLWQNTAGANEFAIQSWAGYQVNKDFTFNFGGAYRLGDAAEALIGADYGDLRVGISYDINVSSLSSVSNLQGGLELAAWYIIKLYKKPDVTPKILCPKF